MDQVVAPATDGGGSRVWLPGIVACISSFLSPNEIACTLRLVNKATAQQFEEYKTVMLSLPSPAHAFIRRWGNPNAFRGLSRQQRQKLLCLTAASGNIANLQIALDSAGLFAWRELLAAAAAAGQLNTCKWLQERGCTRRMYPVLAAAAGGGHRHVCEWLLDSGCPLEVSAVFAAARYGHEELMFWLMEWELRLGHTSVNSSYMGKLLSSAAQGLSLEALQRLHQRLLGSQQQQQQQGGEEAGEGQPAAVLDAETKQWVLAAAAGSPTPDWQAKVEWLEGLGYPRTDNAFSVILQQDKMVDRLQWMCSRGYPVGQRAFGLDKAVGCGNLAGLRFLVQQQPRMHPSPRMEACAALGGHLAVLQYFHARNWPIDAQAVAFRAAVEGHLPVVAWAVETLGITPGNTQSLLSWAACSGSFELLTWLRERGWTWGPAVVTDAVEGGCCEEALEWLVLEQGCPLPADGSPYRLATQRGDLAILRCLHRLGCPWGPNQLVDCITGSLVELSMPAMRCLLELGCPVDWEVVMGAAAHHRFREEDRTALLEWLGEERRRWLPAAGERQ